MVYLQAHAESATSPQPYSSKKLFEFVQISRPILAEVEWARAHLCPTVATPLFLGRPYVHNETQCSHSGIC